MKNGFGGYWLHFISDIDVVADAEDTFLWLEQTVEVGQLPFVAGKVVSVVGLAQVICSGPRRFLAVGCFL